MISLKGNKWLPWVLVTAGLGLVGTVGGMLFFGKKDQQDLETIVKGTRPPIHQTTNNPINSKPDYQPPKENPGKEMVETPIPEAIKNYDTSILTPTNLLESYYTAPSISQSVQYFHRVATDMASMTNNDLAGVENWNPKRKNQYFGLQTETDIDVSPEEGFAVTKYKLNLDPNSNPYGDLQVDVLYDQVDPLNNNTIDHQLPYKICFRLRDSENFNGLNPLLKIWFKDVQDSNGITRTLVDYEVEGYIPARSKTQHPVYTATSFNTNFNETTNNLESMIRIEPALDSKFQPNSPTDNLTSPEDHSSQAYLNWVAQRLHERKKIDERTMPFPQQDKDFSDAMAKQLRYWAVDSFGSFNGLYKHLLEN